MTTTQALRMERRAARRAQERERRMQAMKAAVVIVGMLLAFGLAGAVDYHDRAMDLSGCATVEAGW